jgi:hypothetical protein
MFLDRLWPSLTARKLFVSHAYEDAKLGIVDSLVERLPMNARPYIFPPINVPPEARVSDDLVNAILDCDGLISIQSGNAKKSVWVAFERDFALRNKRLTYVFNPESRIIRRDRSRPIEPNIVCWVWGDWGRAEQRLNEINAHFRTRNIKQLSGGNSRVPPDAFEDIVNDVKHWCEQGAHLIIYACNGGPYDLHDLSMFAAKLGGFKQQTLLAVLEPLDDGDGSLLHWSRNGPSVALYDAKNPSRLDWRRVDDLIVRSFSMMLSLRSTGANRLGWLANVQNSAIVDMSDVSTNTRSGE